MKKILHFFTLITAIVMMALYPTRTWAQVASVTIGEGTETDYSSLDDAFTAAYLAEAGSYVTIKLLKDTSIVTPKGSSAPDYRYTVTFNSIKLYLDLNGHKLETDATKAAILVDGADFIIKDESDEKNGELKQIAYKSGSLTIYGGKFTAGSGKSFASIRSGLPQDSIQLCGGIFTKGFSLNHKNDWDKIYMPDEYALYNTDGEVITPTSNAIGKTVYVGNFHAHVACKDGTKNLFEDVDDAFYAVENSTKTKAFTVTLLKDYVMGCESPGYPYAYLNNEHDITFDLNGHVLDVSNTYKYALSLSGQANLTIKDSDTEGKGLLKGDENAIYYTGGKLTIESGKFDGSQYGLNVDVQDEIESGNITLHGGIFGKINAGVADNWSKLGMADYCFVDTLTKSVVIPNSQSTTLIDTVAVKPLKDCAVASVEIGDKTTYYLSVEDAFTKAADGTKDNPATVKLLKSVKDMSSGNSDYITLTKGVIYFDLNGDTLDVSAMRSQALIIDENANLTINDKTGKGMVKSNSNAVCYRGGNLTIKGGIYKGDNSYALYISKNSLTAGDVTLHGGTFCNSSDDKSIWVGDNASNWRQLGMERYCFVDTLTNNSVLPTNRYSYLAYSVKVMPLTAELANASVKIGDAAPTYYMYLDSAFAKASNGTEATPATVTLLKSVKAYSPGNSNSYISLTTGVINFELNGYTFDLQYGDAIHINGANLTINDKTGKGMVKAGSNSVQYNSGSLAINGGIYKGNSSLGLYIYKSGLSAGDVTLHGGTFCKGSKGYSITVDNYYSDWGKLGMDGFCFVDTLTNKCVVPGDYSLAYSVKVVPITEELAVASVKIGETGTPKLYASLPDAFTKAADGTKDNPATVKLLKSVKDMSSGNSDYITLTKGVIYFDLNGDTLDVSAMSSQALIIDENANLTINDATGKGMVKSNSNAVYYRGGNLTIKGGIYKGDNSYALYISKNSLTAGDVTLHGGTFCKGSNGYSITVDNYYSDWGKLGMDGFCFVDTLTNKCVVPGDYSLAYSVKVVPITEELAVASVKIGETGTPKLYASLPDAFTQASNNGTASDTATVTLLKKIEMPTSSISLTTGVIKLDLNGDTLDVKTGDVLEVRGADLTINDATGKGMIKAGYVPVDYYSGNITINGGIYQGVIAVSISKEDLSAGDVTLHGGTFYKGMSGYSVSAGNNKSDWGMLGMDEYCFVNTQTGNTVVPGNTPLKDSVTVVPITADNAYASVKIGDADATYHVILNEAFKKAAAGTEKNPATVTMLKDYKYASGTGANINSGVMTLDLNDKKISADNSSALSVNNGANVTIVDNGTEGSIVNTVYAVDVKNATLKVENGTFKSTGNNALRCENSTVKLRGGHYITESTDSSAVYVNGEKSALANGMAYYDAEGNELPDSYAGHIKDTEGNMATNISLNYADDLTYDENTTSKDEVPEVSLKKTYKTITVLRTMKTNMWNTLCLPFSMTEDELIENFGEKVKVKKLAGIEDNYVTFTDTTGVAAGVPYVIKPTIEDIEEIKVENKKVETGGTGITIPLMPYVCISPQYRITGNISELFTTTLSSLIGAINKESVSIYAYILNDNVFYYVNSEVEVKGFRWIIMDLNEIIDVLQPKAKTLYTNLDDDNIATGIRNVDDTNGNDKMFNIAGQRVTKSAKGIIISNGRKYINK